MAQKKWLEDGEVKIKRENLRETEKLNITIILISTN